MNLTLKTAPTTGLLDLQEAKDHLRVDHAEDDQLIQGIIDAVHEHLEGPDGHLGRALLTQSWTGKLDRWPCWGEPVMISLPPLVSVDQVRYVDGAGVTQVWAADQYQVQKVGTQPSKLWPAYQVVWPTIRCQPDAIEIDFTCGYGGPEKLPAPVRAAALLLIADLYDNRSAQFDRQMFDNKAADFLLDPYRIWYF